MKVELQVNNKWLLFFSDQPPAFLRYFLIETEVEGPRCPGLPRGDGIDSAHPLAFLERKAREREPPLRV